MIRIHALHVTTYSPDAKPTRDRAAKELIGEAVGELGLSPYAENRPAIPVDCTLPLPTPTLLVNSILLPKAFFGINVPAATRVGNRHHLTHFQNGVLRHSLRLAHGEA